MRSTLSSLMHGLLGQVVTGLLAVLLTGTPVQAQNVCNTTASLVNPAAREPGIGGTGAPVLGALRAWWHALLGGAAREDPNVVAVRPGIGGTGISDNSVAGAAGGLSGTGGIGGTGIVGVITGFASICVNGVEVHYDANTPLVTDGRVAMARELAVGQVVAVRASGAGAQVAARNIAVIHAAVGPVHRVDAATGQLELLGQIVRTDNPAELSGLKTGDWAQVSGYRLFSGEVMASRIEPVTPQAQAQITGQISRIDGSGFTMHGTRVSLDHLSLPPGVADGTEFSVRGRWDGSSLRAQDIEMEPTRRGLGAVDRVVLEGYVHALSGGELTLGNSVVTLAPDVQISGGSASNLAVNQRVQLIGRVGADQRITVDRLDLRGDASGGGQSGRGRSGSGGSGRSGNSGKGGSSGSSDGSAGSGSSSDLNSGSSGSGSSGSGSSGGGGGGSGGGGGGGGQK